MQLREGDILTTPARDQLAVCREVTKGKGEVMSLMYDKVVEGWVSNTAP